MTTPTDPRRDALVRQQRQVARLKGRMKKYIEQTPELERYYEEYRGQLTEFKFVSWPGELVERIAAADVAFVGDFHTLIQSQKLLAHLLEMVLDRLAGAGRQLFLAMEAFRASHQEAVDRYQRGELAFDEFLQAVSYRRTWGFPVAGYRLLLDLATRRQVRVIGINSSSRSQESLVRRDERAAAVIAKVLFDHPGALVIAQMGDLHVASNHLPERVLERFEAAGRKLDDCIVYTNSETIYWKLMEMNLEYIVNVVRINSRQFCVMNATPLAKYDSYLRFMEGMLEDDGSGEGGDEEGEEAPSPAFDFEERVVGLARQQAAALGLGRTRLADFALACWRDNSETVPELLARYGGDPAELPQAIAALQMRQPLWLGPSTLLLHSYSLNDAADAAARLLLRSLGWRLTPTPDRNSYFADILHEAFAFFCSKLINPKRACRREGDLEEWLQRQRSLQARPRQSQQLEQAVAGDVLPHLQALREGLAGELAVPLRPEPRWWRVSQLRRRHAVALLGQRLGERLFYSAQVGLPHSRLSLGRNRRLNSGQIAAEIATVPAPGEDLFARYLALWQGMADVAEHQWTRRSWM